jgi:hypothetical protein
VAAKLHPDAARCHGCDKIGPVWQDLDDPASRPLCDSCQYAQVRWEAWQYHVAHPGAGYPYHEGPPKSPP